VLDPFLAPEGVADRRLELLGQGHDLGVRPGTAAAAEKRYAPSLVQEVGQTCQVGIRGPYYRERRDDPVG